MVKTLTLTELRAAAVRVGLHLSDEELARLLPGVNRSRQQVAELERFIERGIEPAGIFSAGSSNR